MQAAFYIDTIQSVTDERFARLQHAKETLCDPERRKDYDSWRNCGMAITYGDWRAKKDSIHTVSSSEMPLSLPLFFYFLILTPLTLDSCIYMFKMYLKAENMPFHMVKTAFKYPF